MGFLSQYDYCVFCTFVINIYIYFSLAGGLVFMMYTKKIAFHILLITIGIGLSFWNTWLGHLLTILYLFLFLYLSPLTKGRENLWMFIMIIFIFIPLNRHMIRFLLNFFSYDIEMAFLLAAGFWTLEQILFGIVTSMIWPKQKIIRVNL